jgi:hypothetical protein
MFAMFGEKCASVWDVLVLYLTFLWRRSVEWLPMERKVSVFFFSDSAFSVRQIMILTQSELEVAGGSIR